MFNLIINPSKKKQIILSCFFLFFSLFILFPAGTLSSDVNVEIASHYLADVAKNHTVDNKFVSMIVEAKDEKRKPLKGSATEFYSLDGMFRDSKPNFAGTVNGNKENEVYFSEIDHKINMSFLYVYPSGFSNKEYQDHWRQEVYPIELMFKGEHSVESGVFSFFYISQTHADKFLEKEGLEKTKENYEKMIGKKTYLKFNNNEYLFSIANIYLETGYYYESLRQVIGDFFIGYNKYPEGINKQALYFLNEHEFQNKYYIDYAKGIYPASDFNYSFGTYNLKDSYAIDSSITQKMFESNNGVGSILLFILSIFLMLGSIVLIIRNNFIYNWKCCLIYLFFLFMPYIVFLIVYLITGNVLLFSNFSTLSYLVLGGVFIVIMFLFFLIENVKIRKVEKCN